MAVRRGDIVLAVHADFGKPRPAVVVQADTFNDNPLTVLVCPLTTDLRKRLPLRPVVSAGASTGLREQSQIMTDKMLALPSARIRDVIGSIDESTRDQLDQALLILLDPAK